MCVLMNNNHNGSKGATGQNNCPHMLSVFWAFEAILRIRNENNYNGSKNKYYVIHDNHHITTCKHGKNNDYDGRFAGKLTNCKFRKLLALFTTPITL